jgi:dTMP kinase
MSNRSGLFISFEGIEGSGKSTQIRMLLDRLRKRGLTATENREPGMTAIGKQIRQVLLDPANGEITPMAELLLMFASRAQAAAEIILPALHRGEILVSDRFTDSTLAYQGYARGLELEKILSVHQLTLGTLFPDVTILLDIDVQTGVGRALSRNEQLTENRPENRIDQYSIEFHERVAAGYREIAAKNQSRFRVVEGDGSPEQVSDRIWSIVDPIVSSR